MKIVTNKAFFLIASLLIQLNVQASESLQSVPRVSSRSEDIKEIKAAAATYALMTTEKIDWLKKTIQTQFQPAQIAKTCGTKSYSSCYLDQVNASANGIPRLESENTLRKLGFPALPPLVVSALVNGCMDSAMLARSKSVADAFYDCHSFAALALPSFFNLTTRYDKDQVKFRNSPTACAMYNLYLGEVKEFARKESKVLNTPVSASFLYGKTPREKHESNAKAVKALSDYLQPLKDCNINGLPEVKEPMKLLH